MFFHGGDDLRAAFALADHAGFAGGDHHGSVCVHAVACRGTRRADDLSGLCRRRSDVIDRCVLDVKRQRLARFEKLTEPLVRRVARGVDDAGKQAAFAAFDRSCRFPGDGELNVFFHGSASLQHRGFMPRDVAVDIDRNGKPRNVRGHPLDVDRKRGGPSAETLRTDAERVDLFEKLRFEIGVIGIRVPLVRAAHQRLFRKIRRLVERAADADAYDDRRARVRSRLLDGTENKRLDAFRAVARFQHGEAAHVLAAEALRRDGDLQPVARNDLRIEHGGRVVAGVDAAQRVFHDGFPKIPFRIASAHALVDRGAEIARDMHVLSDLQKHAAHAGVLTDGDGVRFGDAVVFDDLVENALRRFPRFVFACVLDAPFHVARQHAVCFDRKPRDRFGQYVCLNFSHNSSLFLHFPDMVDDRAVAVDDVGDDLFTEPRLFGHAARAFRERFEIVNIDHFDARVDQPLSEFRVLRVDRNALLCHEHVDRAAGGRDAGHAVGHDRKPRAGQRRNDHGELRARRRVAVSAGTAHDAAVTVGMHVDVEIGVDLRCAEDDDVERIDDRALCKRGCVMRCGDLAVARIVPDGFDRLQIKALHVHQRVETALVQHIDEVSRDAAEAEASADLFLQHDVLEIFRRRQRRAARAGLEAEALFEESGRLDDVDRGLRHQKSDGIPCDFRCAGNDALRIADGVHNDHRVHVGFGDRPVAEGIGVELVRDRHDELRVFRVRDRVAQRAACALSELTGQIAHRVTGGRCDERHVDRRSAVFDVGGTSAVRAELHGILHAARGNEAAEPRGHIVREDRRDDAVLNVLLQRRVRVKERACVHGKIADAELCDLIHHHVQNVVAVAEMVVERNGHAGSESAVKDRFANGIPDLIHLQVLRSRAVLPLPKSAARVRRSAYRSSCRAGRPRPCPAVFRCGSPQTRALRIRCQQSWG